MSSSTQFTVIVTPDQTTCYVWEVTAHGRSTRRRIVTSVMLAPGAERTPPALLRAIAQSLEDRLPRAWAPAERAREPLGAVGGDTPT